VSNDAAPQSTAQRSAIVTGSSSGIGCAIAQHLLAQGWQVQGLDLAPATITHAQFNAVQVDLCDAQRLSAVAAGLPVADAFVHAAGVLRVGRLGELDAAAGELMWRIHTQAASILANAVVPRMVERQQGHAGERAGGRVVFIGSRVSQGMPGRSQYAATKAALVALAKSWASEVVAQGVTVNVISPAATQTAMINDPSRAGSAPRVPPIGRLILPQEIADLVSYLLSDSAAAITGQDIAVCGGASLPR
jgi:3-oxoacyl-[acyl-carrier protein] reductase